MQKSEADCDKSMGYQMKPTRLFLLRHGQVAGFEEKRYNGQSNVPLTEAGRTQMDLVCRALHDATLEAIYSSDLDRCTYGAAQLGQALGVSVFTDAALRELDCGQWQGLPWLSLAKDFPEDWQARLQDIVHHRMPGGESFHDAASRVRPVLQAILTRHAGQQVALFGHGGINRIFLLDALGAPLDAAFSIVQDYACLNIIDYLPDGSCRIQLMNGTYLSVPERVRSA